MPITTRRSAEITVALPLTEAMALFTAEGERRWADGWDPWYPAPERRDGPGAVFATAHATTETTWVMVEHECERVAYARVTPGLSAGTVGVQALGFDDGRTRVRVSYDLTALSAQGEAWLAAFDDGFTDHIAGWEVAIAAMDK